MNDRLQHGPRDDASTVEARPAKPSRRASAAARPAPSLPPQRDPPARNSLRVVWIGLGMLSLALVWAERSEIEQSVRATGQVIASSRTQVVQAANDGVVESFKVSEGQSVRKGQLLVMLERNQAEAAFGDSTGKVAALKANLIRLRAEVFSRPLEFPADVRAHPSFVENQTQLFNRRQKALQAELAALEDTRSLIQRELDMSQPLLKTGDIGQVEVLRLQRQLAEVSGSITNRRNKYFQDAQAEMTKAEEDLSTQEQLLAERNTNLERTEIRAPADGLVRRLQVSTPGARVRAGDTIMELLPTGTQMVVEAKLKPADRGFILVGLPATVKLDAYDYAIYGSLKGHVSYVSPDALSEPSRTGTEHIYYQVQVSIDPASQAAATSASSPASSNATLIGMRSSLPGLDGLGRLFSPRKHAASELAIQPGMTTTVEIKTGSQTVLQYLTKPVTKTLSESMTER